ncbi:MAG: hypothetical protein ABJA64_02330 [Candidatus Saccharibacteria bacterium]
MKIQIGIDILVTTIQNVGLGDRVNLALARADDVNHIECAERWRDEMKEAISELGRVADRALVELDESIGNALMSLMSDFRYNDNYPRLMQDLTQQPFSYVSKLIAKMANLDEEEMRATLQALSAYGKGE